VLLKLAGRRLVPWCLAAPPLAASCYDWVAASFLFKKKLINLKSK
jgi:hypothetical protein